MSTLLKALRRADQPSSPCAAHGSAREPGRAQPPRWIWWALVPPAPGDGHPQPTVAGTSVTSNPVEQQVEVKKW